MATRTLETILIGRDLLSPTLAKAGANVTAFTGAVTGANEKAAAASTVSARAQGAAATQVVEANTRATQATVTASAQQARAKGQVVAASAALAAAENAAAGAVVSANTRLSGAVAGTAVTYQRSAASLRDKLGLQALDGAAADRSAAANSRAGASAAVFTKALDSNSTALARDAAAAATSTTSTSTNTAARERATLAARAQATATGALASSNGLLGTSLTPLTAGLGAVGLGLAYAGYRGMEFDAAMSGVQAASQASAGTMGELRQAAITLGADTKYSAEEAAQGITEMSKAGVATEDILRGGLKGALDLAAAGQMDVADAAELGATAMNVFNLEGDQMSHVADLLAAGAGKAQGSVHDMGMALNQSALVANQAGLSIEDTAGALAMFASNGLIGSDAGTSFKTMLQALTPNSNAAAEAMAEIGFNAYDAQGNFIGLEAVAGQLKSGLSGLTEEQRASTLETIFGSDAVRAASVLYSEGSAGVAEWARNVDDAGFASRQAAQLTDNLKGDLERLGGAFDAAMTTIGGGTQGVLRELVQALTWVVETGGNVIKFVQNLPGPVQAAAAAMLGLYLATGPLSGALMSAGTSITGFGTKALAATTSTAGFSAATSGLLAALGGPVGIAIGASTVAIGYMVNGLLDMGEATVDTAGYQEQLASALQTSKGAIDENVRALAAQRAAETDITDNTSLLDYAQQAGVDLGLMTDALLGNRDAAEQVTKQLDDYLQVQAAAALARGEDAATVAAWTDQNNIAKDAIQQMIPVLGDAQVKNDQLAEATGASGGAMEVAAEQTRDFRQKASDAKETVDSLKAGLDALTGATVTQFEAEAQLQDAIEKADGALEDMTGSVLDADGKLNAYSESGRKAGDVLLEVRDKGNQLISTLIQQGATEDEVRAADARLRQSFIDTATRMGVSSTAANTLADDILGIPDQRNTSITADTTQASRAVEDFVAKVTGKSIVLTGDFKPGAGINVRKAMGGSVFGPGTETSDSIPALLSNNEHVWTAAEVRAAGGHQAVEGLREAARSGTLATYATGGPVLADQYSIPVSLTGLPDPMKISVEGTAGTGQLGSGIAAMFAAVKAQFPEARLNSGLRPGDPGYHGRGRAIDLGQVGRSGGNGHPYLAAMNRWLHDKYGANLAELIYTGAGDDRPDLKNGRPLNYGAATNAAHRNHVHVARQDGGPVWPGLDFLVGERGPEIARFDAPATVYPNGAAPAAMPGYGMGGGMTLDVERLAAAVARHAGRQTSIAVDARGFGADAIARAITTRQQQQDALASRRG